MMTSEDAYAEEFDENELETFEEDRNEANAEEQASAEHADDSKKTVKPKRVIRNPQPKLNAERLKGKRGLTALESYFDRVKYKGRGHEEEDLSVILKTYEYWCHRLFPKYPFDECITKIESLGSKRPVKTYVKRIRLDMVLEDEPPINDNNSIIGEEVDNQFDDLLDIPEVQTPIEITEEQQERIRLNREKAERLRKEKLRKIRETAASSLGNTENMTQLSVDSTNMEFQNPSSSQIHSDQEEDVDSIFDNIQSFDSQRDQEQDNDTGKSTGENIVSQDEDVSSSSSIHLPQISEKNCQDTQNSDSDNE